MTTLSHSIFTRYGHSSERERTHNPLERTNQCKLFQEYGLFKPMKLSEHEEDPNNGRSKARNGANGLDRMNCAFRENGIHCCINSIYVLIYVL